MASNYPGQSQPSKPDEESQIPYHISKELYYLNALWNQKKRCFEGDEMFQRFYEADNPYTYVLDIIFYGNESKRNNLTPLTQAVFSQFEKWIRQNKSATHHLNLHLKMSALNMVMNQKNGVMIQTVCKIFEMEKSSRQLKSIIDRHISLGRYKQACYAVISLNLQDSYTFEQIVYPLMFEDKMVLVYQYLENYPDLQIEFAKNVDVAAANKVSLSNLISSLSMQNSNRTPHRDVKWLQKLLSNFIKKFKISIENCPNLIKNRSYGALNYLFHKRFTEGSMSDASWKEMVLATVADERSLQNELLIKLACVNELDLAVEMANILKIPPKDWPDCLRFLLENNPEGNTAQNVDESAKTIENSESWDDDIQHNHANFCLTFRLSNDDIILVDTLEKFETCVNVVSACYDVVGVDAEWRPSMGITKETLSLLQIATWDNVYLLDVPSLLKTVNAVQWNNLMQNVFCNPNLLKLGYGMESDLDMLRGVLKDKKLANHKFVNILDFAKFFPQLTQRHPDLLKVLSDSNSNQDCDINETDNRGLSKLCQIILGKPLDKVEQFSDWERRPLRKSQIVYAALDAYCLLQLYEKLYHALLQMELDLYAVIDDFFANKLKPPKVSSKPKKETPEKAPSKATDSAESSICAPVPVTQFKVVVDNPFIGLGKQLRIRGADVIMLAEGGDPSDLVKIAQEEERYILTSGSRYERVKGYMPPNMCFNVPQSLTAVEQATLVCRYYNVVCTKDDIFTRCTICNCAHYLKIQSKDMELLWALKKTSSSEVSNSMTPFIECDGGFVTEECFMNTGIAIQMDGLTSEIILRTPMFFVCSQCGKVYWEGSHHRRTKEVVQEWIENTDNRLNEKKEAEVTKSSSSGIHATQCIGQSHSSETVSSNVSYSDKSKTRIVHVPEDLSSDDDDEVYDFVF